jgi:spermidine synthase
MRNESILHEMTGHVPILAHGRVERVLILGATGVGLAREVLKHRGVRDVVQVQSDGGGRHAPEISDGRLQFQVADGGRYVAGTAERFDLILAPMLSVDSLRDVRGCLRTGGVVISTLGAPYVQPRRFFANMKSLSGVFSNVAAYLVPAPGTFGGPVALGWGSNVVTPDAAAREVLAARLADARIDTRYYTPEVHRAAFALPRFIKEIVSAAACPSEEVPPEILDRAFAMPGG